MNMKKTIIATSISLTLGSSVANAALVENLFGAYTWNTDSANFTMLDGNGNSVGGTNNVDMHWDGNGYTASSDYTGPGGAANVTAASTTVFFGENWTAHDIQVFTPGSYSFDGTLGGGNNETGILSAVVPTGFLGMHMLFDWGSDTNIDLFVVAAPSSVFGPGIARSSSFNFSTYTFNCDGPPAGLGTETNCLYDGDDLGSAGKPLGDQTWMLASTDGNGDGIMGISMLPGGPFAGFNGNFNANLTPTPIPVPAAVWLFGSGLLGLVGVARRRKSA